MSRSLLSPSLLALGLAAALPVFAQSHAGHDMAAMDPPAKTAKAPVERVDHSKMDHSKMDHGAMEPAAMDHSTMDHSQMDHAAMGHGTPAPTAPREPIPVPTDADRAAAFPPIAHGAMEHAPEINSLLLIDRLEHWDGRTATARPGRPVAGSAATSTACGCAPMANAARAVRNPLAWKHSTGVPFRRGGTC